MTPKDGLATEVIEDNTDKEIRSGLGAEDVTTPIPVGNDTTTITPSNSTTPTSAPEPEPETGAALAMYGWTTALLLSTLTALLL